MARSKKIPVLDGFSDAQLETIENMAVSIRRDRRENDPLESEAIQPTLEELRTLREASRVSVYKDIKCTLPATISLTIENEWDELNIYGNIETDDYDLDEDQLMEYPAAAAEIEKAKASNKAYEDRLAEVAKDLDVEQDEVQDHL